MDVEEEPIVQGGEVRSSSLAMDLLSALFRCDKEPESELEPTIQRGEVRFSPFKKPLEKHNHEEGMVYDLPDWSCLDLPNDIEITKTVFVLGGFKVGKSRLIRFLNPTVNFPDMDHQARNTEGADFYFVDSTLYIDTEGLFQHHGDFREPLVRTFVLNYLRYQASMVVYVLEKTLEDDHEMISDLWNVFRTSNTIERFVVIHNYRNITEHENFHYVVDKNERYLVPECYEHRNDIGYSHSYGDDDTVRYVTHYLIGNHDSLRNHNETVFRKVNDSIGQLLRRDRIDRNEFLRRLCYAFQETLNFFALFDSQFAHVRPIEIQNRIKFQLVLREGAPLEMRFKLDKDYKVPLVNISQHTRRGVASLKLLITCAGIILDEEEDFPICLNVASPLQGQLSFWYGGYGYPIIDNTYQHFVEIRFKSIIVATRKPVKKRLGEGIVCYTLETAAIEGHGGEGLPENLWVEKSEEN